MNRKQRRAAGAPPKPDNPDAVLQRAVEAVRTGQLETAEKLYRQLAAEKPDDAVLQAKLGDLAQRQGDLAKAVACFRQATILRPDYAEAYARLGNALLLSGNPAEAVEAYRTAIGAAQDVPETFSNLGNALVRLERYEEAIAAHLQAVTLRPDFAVGHFNLGNALLRAGRLSESVLALGKAVELKPDLATAHSDLGNVLYTMGRRDDAIASYKNAIAVDPNFAEAYSNLANPLTDEDRLDEAMAMTIRSIQINPERPEAHSNFGNVLAAADRLKESFGAYRHALMLKPDYPEGHANLGHAYARLGQSKESIVAYRNAITARPDYAEAHLYLAMMLLRQGEMIEGWREYEWRWRTRPFEVDKIQSDAALWNGEALEGKTILLYAEQGLGDTIQFIRYTKMIAGMGGTVFLALPAPLARLAWTAPGVSAIIAPGEALPSTDYRMPLMSLPRVLGPELADIPQDIPYLSADPQVVESSKQRLEALPGLKVGLVWAGAHRAHDRAASRTDRRRSLSLVQLAPLFEVQGVSFVSLQKGDAARQASDYAVRDYMSEIGDFADTAALVAALDMVIAVDTSVAHLAGALGKPVWILSRFDGCWRWLEEGDTTPWYPSARLFRQKAPGEWDEVITRVTAALHEKATGQN